eukprot:GGOE01054795.1.p3 GENE.GGOE01054795.1~~GGOE01054795.1.p3  ORF type:complete len:131 (+),score=2.04 GGOE01054795.1:482-874(+)
MAPTVAVMQIVHHNPLRPCTPRALPSSSGMWWPSGSDLTWPGLAAGGGGTGCRSPLRIPGGGVFCVSCLRPVSLSRVGAEGPRCPPAPVPPLPIPITPLLKVQVLCGGGVFSILLTCRLLRFELHPICWV